jgi:hypothetical protein
MSLGNFFGAEHAAGNLSLASRLRITADHLAGLHGPAQTMLRVTGVSWETQENKMGRALTLGARPPRDLAFPALEGTDALSGLPAMLVLQAGSLTYEAARLMDMDRSAFGPFDAETLSEDQRAKLRSGLSPLLDDGLVVMYEGEGEKDGKVFARYRLARVRCDDTTAQRYAQAWRADASSAPKALEQNKPLQLEGPEAPTDPVPF